MIVKCQNCGNSFKVSPYLTKKGNGRFCSRQCFGTWQSKNRIYKSGEGGTNWRGGKIEKNCLVCGRPFLVYRCHDKRKRFCNYGCTRKWLKKNNMGNGNPNWKGGKSPLNNLIRSSKKYSEWRFLVFERDNFKCQKCGSSKSGELQAHHIKMLSSMINDVSQNPVNFFIDGTALGNDIWDVDNGVTLCKYCHKREHYGDRE